MIREQHTSQPMWDSLSRWMDIHRGVIGSDLSRVSLHPSNQSAMLPPMPPVLDDTRRAVYEQIAIVQHRLSWEDSITLETRVRWMLLVQGISVPVVGRFNDGDDHQIDDYYM